MKKILMLLVAAGIAVASPAQVNQEVKPARKCECKHPRPGKKVKKHKHRLPCPPRQQQEQNGVN